MSPTPSPRIVVTGNVVADIVARPVGDVPRHGSLHPEMVRLYTGGCAGNAALVMARLGVPVELVACVGADALGRVVIEEFSAAGISTTHVRQVEGASTDTAIVLVDEAGGRRFIASPDAGRRLRPADLTDDILEGAFALHVGGFFAARGLEDGTLPARLEAARAQGLLTSLDLVGGSARERREHLFPLLPHLDLLLLNEDEGEKVTGEPAPAAILDALAARGAEGIVLKRGSEGCLWRGAHDTLALPAPPAQVVDTTGAGDAFVAALLASLARGMAMAEALRYASAAGAATTEATGATGDWHGWEALERDGW